MAIPDVNDKKWQELVTGKKTFQLDFFPLKLLLARLQLQTKLDPSDETISKCATELRQLLVKNEHIPNAQKDINKIFGGQKNISRWRRLFKRN